MIDRFSKEEFEQALPKEGNRQFWEYIGTCGHEYIYAIPVGSKKLRPDDLQIRIHSSVNVATNIADDTGQNSIRCYLYSPKYDRPIGNSECDWVTRVSGWEGRMLKLLRLLYKRALQSKRCPKCSGFMVWFKAKTKKNKGRIFYKCQNPACAIWGGWAKWN